MTTPRTVLVVEDNPITRKMLMFAVRSAGYRTLEAGDGKTALEIVAATQPDLVVQDLLLPDMDGIELARRIRALPAGRETALVALSGLSSKLDEARGLNVGFASFLFKPIEPSRLTAHLAELLRPEDRPATLSGARRRVMIVDDDPVFLNLQRIRLEQHGFAVHAVADSGSAVEEARRVKPDAIVTDLLMPTLDGLDLCRAVRRDPALAGIPVIIASAGAPPDGDTDYRMAETAGASAFVPSTPSCDAVIRALTECLASGGPPAPPVIPEDHQLRSKFNGRLVQHLDRLARLNHLLAREAASKTAQLSILTAVADVLARTTLLETVLEDVLARTLDLAGVSIGAIYVVQPGGQPVLARQLGYPTAGVGQLTQFFGRRDLLEQALSGGRPVPIPPGTFVDPILGPRGQSDRDPSGTLVPLVFAGERVGVLFLASPARQLDSDWVDIASAVAVQVAQAVVLTRSMDRLTASEERYRTLFQRLPTPLYRSTPDGRVLEANPALVAMCGYPDLPSLLSSDVPSFFVRPADRLAFRQRLEQEQLVRGFEFELRRFDGSTIWVRDTSHAVYDDAGQIEAFEGNLEDITERKRAQDARDETERLLRSVIEGTNDGVFVKDLTGRYVIVNSGAGAIAGMPSEAMIGRTDAELFPADRAEFIRGADSAILAAGETTTYEETIIGPATGKSLTLLTTKGVHRDHDGRIAGVFGVTRDVTRHRQLENELRQAQKMEAIGRLAGGIAHDFNNLLSVIMSYAGLLSAEPAAGELRRSDLNEIVQAANRAAGLTRQLLAFSRQQVLEPKVLDLNELVMGVEKMLRRIIGEDIELTTKLGSSIGPTKADPGQLEQVILNLAVNARDAMPDGGVLTLETDEVELDAEQCAAHGSAAPGRYVMLAVTDTGIGMDQATQARIFEPFFTTKDKEKGTGLGLSTAYGIVHQSEGFIWVYSEINHGTTFKVYLPRLSEQAVTAAAVPIEETQTVGHETILLVEDEDTLRRVAHQVLERQGYAVLVASCGAEAIACCEARRERIDLIVTDVVMPGINGREAAQRLLQLHPEAKLLYMSGYTDDTVLRLGVFEPGTAFMQKPFSAVALARKVREVLSTRVGEPEASNQAAQISARQ